MFIFYGSDTVATGYPTLLGISVTRANTKAKPTSNPTDHDPQRLNIVAAPFYKPVNTKWWVYIPDYFTWIGTSETTLDEGAGPLSVPTAYAALRPVIYHRDVTNTGLLPGSLRVKVATTGVCFYSDEQHYIMAGYCPPNLKGDTLLGELHLTAGYVDPAKITTAYYPIISCFENEWGLDNYKLLGIPNEDVTWNPMDGETTPIGKVNKTFVQLKDAFTTFSDPLTVGAAAIPLVVYAHSEQWNTLDFLNRPKVKALLTDAYWLSSTNAGDSKGQFVVR